MKEKLCIETQSLEYKNNELVKQNVYLVSITVYYKITT